MERYQMNRANCRQPYTSWNSQQFPGASSRSEQNCQKPADSLYAHADHMPVAMAYVPFQKYQQPFDLCYALSAGTIFPDLCKPFCGKRCVGG